MASRVRPCEKKMVEDVRLRPTMADDIVLVVAAEQDPDTRPFILPWTHQQHAAALSDPDFAHLIVEATRDQRLVGFVILAGLTNPHLCLEFRRIVVSAKRHGFGRAAVRAVKRLAFAERGAHRLWLDVKEDNRRARRLYEAEGFATEGVLRECLRRDDGFESLVVMSMLAAEYHKATARERTNP